MTKPTDAEIRSTWNLFHRLRAEAVRSESEGKLLSAAEKLRDADRMADVAISEQKAQDSWLYRTFGW